MIGLRAIARPYAKAVFDCAANQKQLDAWAELLASALSIIHYPGLKTWLNDPTVRSDERLDLFLSILTDSSDLQKNFLRLLVLHHRLELLSEIEWWYGYFRSEYENTITARVTSAYPLTSSQSLKLKLSLGKHFSKKVFLENQEDSSLLGGAVIRVGDHVFDGSGRKRLKMLGEQLRGINT